VQLAESLRIDVIAEGIETPEQLAAVPQLGCRCGQGFAFGRPTPADRMEQVFRRSFVTGR
jgi:EAL domain-containing protein (putative c-di-GMP-specific phosphodiesterase class I)